MSANGGITKGKSHKEGGIPMVVKSTGQQVELEGGEGVINKRNMASDIKFEFQGKQMTTCEIASAINSANGNGVKIDCDDVTGKKYAYEDGGVVFIDYNENEIMYEPIDKKYYANDKEFDSLEEAQKFLDSGGVNEDLRGAYERGLFKGGGKILDEYQEEQFQEWLKDGNVIEREKGVYSTQDAQYRNRIQGMDGLRKYVLKEFFSDSYEGGGAVKTTYVHKYNPNITLEVIEYTNKGVKGLQRNPTSLSKKEKKEGIIVNYSDSELKELFQKKYEGGGGVGNVYIALSKTKNGLLLSERFDKQITHQQLFDYYKKRGYEIIDSNIFKVTNKDVLDVYKDAISKFIEEKYNELVDWENTFLSYEIVGDRIIAQSCFVQTQNGKEYKITPNDLVNKKFAEGGGIKNYKSLIGKYVNIYSMGVSLPTEHQIKNVEVSGENFRYRYVTLKFDLGIAPIPFDEATAFMNNDIIYVNNNKEEFGIQLIPNQYKKGGSMSNSLKYEDYETASMAMGGGGYEEQMIVPQDVTGIYKEGGAVEYVDTNGRNTYYFLRFPEAIGSFAWMYNDKYNEGILYNLDDFDKDYYSHLTLKSGEKLFRYSTDRMIDGSKRLIKINLDKGLIYFMSEDNDENDDKNINFNTRGIKSQYIVLNKDLFAGGGNVPKSSKMFHLPLELAVYVPSTQDVDKVISDSELDTRVDEVSKYLATMFGGFTKSDKIGGFVSSKSELVTEEVVPVVSFATKEDYEANKNKLVTKLSDWAREWGQEAIGFEFEGDLYYVPQKFEGGGDVRDFDWYQMWKKQELKRGTEHEMEHVDTISKFKKEGVSDEQVAEAIAKDHLEEDENYYIELENMEKNNKKLTEALKDFETQKTYRKNSRKYNMDGSMMSESKEIVHLEFTEDFIGVIRGKDGKYITESMFPKGKFYKFSFLLNDGFATALEFDNTGAYVLVPNDIINIVGFDEKKYGGGGSIMPYQSVNLDANDKSILEILRTIDDRNNVTSQQREKIGSFKGNNVVNDLSSKMIQKIYGILFKNHNVENKILNLYLSNIGVGNILLFAPSFLDKTMVSFDENNQFNQVEKDIADIITQGKTPFLYNDFDMKEMDAIIHVYSNPNPETDTLCNLFYKTNKKAIALGVCEFTSKQRLNDFQASIVINQGSIAQNQMITFTKSNEYFIVNEGITNEGQYTLIYTMTKY